MLYKFLRSVCVWLSNIHTVIEKRLFGILPKKPETTSRWRRFRDRFEGTRDDRVLIIDCQNAEIKWRRYE